MDAGALDPDGLTQSLTSSEGASDRVAGLEVEPNLRWLAGDGASPLPRPLAYEARGVRKGFCGVASPPTPPGGGCTPCAPASAGLRQPSDEGAADGLSASSASRA